MLLAPISLGLKLFGYLRIAQCAKVLRHAVFIAPPAIVVVAMAN
jgi:hypothetical protein